MGSGLPSQRQCTALFLLLPSSSSSTFAEAATTSASTASHQRRSGPAPISVGMSVGSQQKSSRSALIVASARKRSKGDPGPTTSAMSCFFCTESVHSTAVTASLLESIMKVKSFMCIPLQLRDQPVSDIAICSKCFDIVSQIEGWVDMLRQRIFDSHEGAVLYPETPPWLQALASPTSISSSSGGAAKSSSARSADPPSVSLAASPGEKRKAGGGGQVAVPPKKMAAAAAVAAAAGAAGTGGAGEDGVSLLSLPISAVDLTSACSAMPFLTIPVSSQPTTPTTTTSTTPGAPRKSSKAQEKDAAATAALNESAMRSAIHSLTSLVNVVQSPGAARTQEARAGKAVEKAVKDGAKLVLVKEEPVANSHENSPSPTTPSSFDIPKRWCSVCSSSYHNDSVFKRHIVSCHPELCYKCELCGQLFATENSRDIHVSHGCCERPNNRTRVLRCTDCHATFLGKYELKRHVLLTSHMGGVSGNMFNGTIKW